MLSRPDTRAVKGLHPLEFFSFTHLSLRTRFLVTMGIVFIPLVAVALGGRWNMFVEILAMPSLGTQEYTLLSNAWREWKQSTVLVDLSLTTNEPKAKLYQLDQRVNQAKDDLSSWPR